MPAQDGTVSRRRASLRLTPNLESMLTRVMKVHGCISSCDYLAGLVLVDFLRTEGLLDASQIDILPFWVLRGQLVEVEKGKLKANHRGKI